MAVVANPLVVRIFINSTLTDRHNGWSERWPIWETDWSRGLAIALALVQARQNVLSSNAYIQWGCLGMVTPPYWEQTVVTDPLYPLPQWGPASFDMQGVLFDLNNDAGENAPRLFRAVEGSSIHAKRWAFHDMPIPWAPPALPADLTTAPKDLLWQNTLATFRMYAATQQPMSDGHHGEGDGYWVNPYQLICYTDVRTRRVGEHWRRMSWECGNWNHAPWWSPCGCVVTVLRFSYLIPCRFGAGWRLRQIHYYPAKEGATVMTFPTPFYGWARSKENTDFSGVGEARKEQITDWTTGIEYGNAPGTTWTGSQRDFEGYAPLPFWGDGSTPWQFRPQCDLPVTSRPVGPGGIGFGGLPYLPLPPPPFPRYVAPRIMPAPGWYPSFSSEEEAYPKRTPALPPASPPPTPPYPVQETAAGNELLGPDVVFTPAEPTTEGNYLYVALSVIGGATVETPSGWTLKNTITFSADLYLLIFVYPNAPSISSVTFVASATNTAVGVFVEIGDLPVGAADTQNGNTGTSSTVTTGSTGTLSTSNQIILAAAGVAVAALPASFGWDSPFTELETHAISPYANACSVAYLVVSANSAESAEADLVNSYNWCGAINSFK